MIQAESAVSEYREPAGPDDEMKKCKHKARLIYSEVILKQFWARSEKRVTAVILWIDATKCESSCQNNVE